MMPAEASAILKVEDLSISYETRKGDIPAVRHVSFDIGPDEVLGLVGESGCGKSTVAFGISRFLGRNGKILSGSILLQGEELVGRTREQLRRLRGNKMSMVYQDPSSCLNPCLQIGEQMGETLVVHRKLTKKQARRESLEMLQRVYMPDPEVILARYPHQLSGGQQQRVVIGMSLLNNPPLLIMDEPTTALDVTVEATVLDLINELQHEFKTAILYITHDLGVIAYIADSVCVMYAGEIVERSSVQGIFLNALHPYTNALISCLPKLGETKSSSYLPPIPGRVPSPDELPPGCIFEPRCDLRRDECRKEHPALREIVSGHLARCLFAEQLSDKVRQFTQKILGKTGMENSDVHQETIIRAEGVRTYYVQSSESLKSLFGLGRKQYVKAVDDVSFELPRGCTLGIVGESGCGKSTLAKTIVGLEAPTGGLIEFLGLDITTPVRKRQEQSIKELQMVFQNPDSTLNPSFSVGYQIGRPLRRFEGLPRKQVKEEVFALLESVRLNENYYNRMPRQLSGGEKQRVALARAIASHPELVLCDEPTSALDVSVQAAILNLLLELQKQYEITMIFISHDLSVVRFICDYVAVMYLGKLVEIGTAEAIYSPPYHPYTEALLSAVPIPDPSAEQKRVRLSGIVPSALNPPNGCRFNTRCPRKLASICETQEPPKQVVESGYYIYCHIPLEELSEMEPIVTLE